MNTPTAADIIAKHAATISVTQRSILHTIERTGRPMSMAELQVEVGFGKQSYNIFERMLDNGMLHIAAELPRKNSHGGNRTKLYDIGPRRVSIAASHSPAPGQSLLAFIAGVPA